jgi:hypothetical protein
MRRRMHLKAAAASTMRTVPWRLRCCGFVILATLASCTDPTAVGPEPEFIALTDFTSFFVADEPLSQDSCPNLSSDLETQPRRSVSGSSATIAFPDNPASGSASFGSEPGSLFRISDIGLIAISYDNRIAEEVVSARTGQRFSAYGPQYLWRSCTVTLGGRPARLFVIPLTIARGGGVGTISEEFLDGMFATTTTPEGRAVNIRLFPLRVNQFSGDRSRFMRLLPVLGSLRW